MEMEAKIPILQHAKRDRNKNQYFAAISVSVGAFSVGTLLSWTSVALPDLKSLNKSELNSTNDVYPNFTINSNTEAWIGAVLTIGALLTAVPSGYLADYFGRKKILLALTVPLFFNWFLIIFARNANMLLVARFLSGMALGGFFVVAPIYISEIAEKDKRGSLGSLLQLFLCCGILFTSLLGILASWRKLSLILSIIPLIFAIMTWMNPETPLYLLKYNKYSQAEFALRYFQGNIDGDITEELKNMKGDLEKYNINLSPSLNIILKKKSYRRSLVAVVGVLAFQQLCGINAIIFYTVTIFVTADSNLNPTLGAIMINLVQVMISYLSFSIIEKADRKIYLTLSAAGMFLCLSSLGIFFHFQSLELKFADNIFSTIGLLASIILFMIFFSIGFGPIPWMLMGELPAQEIKGFVSGLAIVVNWSCAFFITFTFPLLAIHSCFYTMAAFMALALPFINICIPETRGLSLMDIQKKLNK